MSIVKPLRLGLLARAHRQPPKTYYFVAATGFFDLLNPIDFSLETEMWTTVAPVLGTEPLDICMPKPAGEFLVAGDACAPAGETVRQCVVDVQVGALKKRLAVFGDREWMHSDSGPVFTRPAPFERMPLTWANAFGGAGFDANPSGKGVDSSTALRDGRPAPLPNVENPERLILAVDDKPDAIGVMPVALDNPARQRYAGTIDDTYLRDRFPGLPDDFDWTFYQAAAPDQRASGYFVGDEPIRLAGMHPDHPEIRSRLPGLRARTFVNLDVGDGETEFREISMRCETVWLFPSLGKGVVIYRGGCEITDIDGLDVKDTMLAYERMADPPRSVEHYLAAFKERKDPELAALKFFDEKPLRPDLSEDETAEREEERAAYEAEQEVKREKKVEYAIKSAFKVAGLPEPPAAAIPKPPPLPFKMPVVTPQDLERMDVDLAGVVQAAKRIQTFAKGELERLKAKALTEAAGALTRVQKQTDGLIPAPGSAKLAGAVKSVMAALPQMPTLGTDSPESTEAADADLDADAEVVRTGDAIKADLAAGLAPEHMAELEAALEALSEDGLDTDIENEKVLARARALGLPEGSLLAPAIEQIGKLSPEALTISMGDAPEGVVVPDLGALLADPPTPDAEAPRVGDPDVFLASIGASGGEASGPGGPPAGGQEALAMAGDALKQVGEASPLAGHMMAAVQGDGQGGDVGDGIDRAKEGLDKAAEALDESLAKARLLSPEPLFPTNSMASEVSADLGALILELTGKGETLAGRDLAGANLVGADLSGLDLSGAKLERADLSGAKLTACNLRAAVLTGAKLDGADLGGAILADANLSGVSATDAGFANADLREARLMMAKLAGADLSGARLSGSQVLNADLTRARLTKATIERLVVLQSEMAGIVLDGATVFQSMFIELDLTGVSARKASFRRCVLLKVTAGEADFSEADLSECALIGGVTLDGGCFRDVVAPGSGWRQASLIDANFEAARLDGSDLGEANLTGARMGRASFKRANLSSATMARADLGAANLFEAQVRRTDLSHASLRSANLYSANLDEAELAFCDLTGANLNKTPLARPGRVS